MIKMIIDMYIELGPNISYVLILDMLSKSLKESQNRYRSQVFDIIYNLSHHGHMLTEISKEIEISVETKEAMPKKLHTLKEEPEGLNRTSGDADDISLVSKTPHEPFNKKVFVYNYI